MARMFELFFSNKAEKELRNLDRKLLEKISALLEVLKDSPLPIKEYDLKKISGTENLYRVRLSDYRVVYSVYWNDKRVNILKIERRGDSTYGRL